MDTFDYDKESLSAVARSCNSLDCAKHGKRGSRVDDVSCTDCANWNGRGCSLGRFEIIAKEIGLD